MSRLNLSDLVSELGAARFAGDVEKAAAARFVFSKASPDAFEAFMRDGDKTRFMNSLLAADLTDDTARPILNTPKFSALLDELSEYRGTFTDLSERLATGQRIDVNDFLGQNNITSQNMRRELTEALTEYNDGLPSLTRSQRTAARTGNDAKQATQSFLGRYFSSAPSRRQVLIMSALPLVGLYAFAHIEAQNGGQISQAAMHGAANLITASWHTATEHMTDEEKRKWLTEKVHNAEAIAGFIIVDPFEKLQLNGFVMAAKAASPEDPNAGKQAALAFQFRNPAILALKIALRAKIYEEIHPDLSADERKQMLAEGLIDDIIMGCRCAELDGEVITRDDIEDLLKEQPFLMNTLPSHLADGLKLVYPSLQDVEHEPITDFSELPAGAPESLVKSDTASTGAPGPTEPEYEAGFMGMIQQTIDLSIQHALDFLKQIIEWIQSVPGMLTSAFTAVASFNPAATIDRALGRLGNEVGDLVGSGETHIPDNLRQQIVDAANAQIPPAPAGPAGPVLE